VHSSLISSFLKSPPKIFNYDGGDEDNAYDVKKKNNNNNRTGLKSQSQHAERKNIKSM
jgi:hypothetical protein